MKDNHQETIEVRLNVPSNIHDSIRSTAATERRTIHSQYIKFLEERVASYAAARTYPAFYWDGVSKLP